MLGILAFTFSKGSLAAEYFEKISFAPGRRETLNSVLRLAAWPRIRLLFDFYGAAVDVLSFPLRFIPPLALDCIS